MSATTEYIQNVVRSVKSTLAYVLAGRDDYEVTGGDILWNGQSILEMGPDERAAAGVFLAFQYPKGSFLF